MLKKFRQIDYSELVHLFKTILENRVEIANESDYHAKPHLLILGAGAYSKIPELGPMGSWREVKGTVDGMKLPTVLVLGGGVQAYLKLIALLEATVGIGDYLSKGFIQDRVNPQIQILAQDQPADDEAWQGRMKAFIKSLRGLEAPCRVYLPVENLRITADLTVGKVIFHPNGFEREAIVKPVCSALETKTNPPEEKAQIRQHLVPFFGKYAEAPSCAEVNFRGHESTSREVAYETTRQSINLLRCYIPVLFGTNFEHRIGLSDDTGRRVLPGIVFQEPSSFKILTTLTGYNLEYEVEEITLRFLREKGAFDQLSEVLAKEKANDLELALKTATWWVGVGNHILDPAQQVGALTTGLEALLIPSDVEDKADPLARHAAHLLCPSAEGRPAIARRMKELYGMRSEVVHKGRLDIPVADLEDLKYHCLAVLVEMAKRAVQGWTKVRDLQEAVIQAQFGGEPVSRSVDLIPRGPIRPIRLGSYSSHGEGSPFVVQP